MQTGQTVGYIDSGGTRHVASITTVAGPGPSGYKTLWLSYREGGSFVEVEAVPHESDAEPGAAFWLEKGAQRKQPETEIVGVLDEPAPKKRGKR